ncbi:MAG: glycosyltransferase [Oscillospiraceae bacterium]|nr:glycosyltransferase [Oscillospiraceae bacterium]
MKKSVAVLLSAYNGENYIEEQIESIFHQKGIENITLIVRNDGSEDGTREVLKRLQERHADMIVIDGPNIGLVASFFELLRYAAEGSYAFYALCDHDDYWLPEKLVSAVNALEGKEGPWMYGACSMLADEELQTSGGCTQRKLREISFYNAAIQNFCPGHNQVLNRALLDILLRHTKESPAIYSHDMWITQAAAVTGNIFFDDTPRVLYRQHTRNQLSYGLGSIGWIKAHMKRLKKGEGSRITLQLGYFAECFGDYLDSDQRKEVEAFLALQKSLIKRIRYIFSTKMYRQKRVETLLFKLIYLLGGYRPK